MAVAGEIIIGIDLGTTKSVVAVMEGGKPRVIVNQEGSRTTPSVISFAANNEVLVGERARRQAVTNLENTVSSIKRFMGRVQREAESERRLVAYDVVGGHTDYVKVNIQGKRKSPQQISSLILRKLKEAAEECLGNEINKAVITVPAYFSDAQRSATREACQLAGLEVARVILESSAAALSYGIEVHSKETICVFDLGGGMFDVSILEVGDELVEVLSCNGDMHLGGDDFDEVLTKHIAFEFQQEHCIDLYNFPTALQRLREASEQAKKELSSQQSTDINLPFITDDAGDVKHLQLSITRSKFEELIVPLIERCRQPLLDVMKDAKRNPEDIHEIILSGGSSRIPKVKQLVRDVFGKDPHQRVDPDEAVALGAAIQGGILSGVVKDLVLLDVLGISLGIETEAGIMTVLVERNTTIPTTKTEVFSTASDNQPAVTIRVFQGEHYLASDNRLLGEFSLDGIPPANRGVPRIELKFEIDVNGLVSVTARDTLTHNENHFHCLSPLFLTGRISANPFPLSLVDEPPSDDV
jgi:molecular chaperone DnaK